MPQKAWLPEIGFVSLRGKWLQNKHKHKCKKKKEGVDVQGKMLVVRLDDLDFEEKLFIPMRTKTRIDSFLSSERGLMPGTNTVVTGDPGVGKSTVLLDILADLQLNGKKCLFISGEMNAIDMVGYVRRFPKFGALEILFLGDYSETNPDLVIRKALKQGYDCVMIDSLAELKPT